MSWLFSQALVAEYWEGFCADGAPCVQLSVMPTAQPFWRNGKPMDASRLSRFGLTLQLLTAERGEDMLTWFREDFLARTSPSPVAETDSTESGPDSGERWPASFARWDPDTSTWRTPQCSLLGGYTEFSETWPNSGLMRNGECWERPTLELTTSESEYGFLPTPVAIDTGSRFNQSASRGAATLGAMARFDLWPTPTVKGNYNRKGLSSKSGDGLATAVQKYPTPTATMHKGWSPNHNRAASNDRLDYVIEREASKKWPTPTARDYFPAHKPEYIAAKKAQGHGMSNLNDAVGGRLNPTWVEWLMGWPIGWTALQPLAMDRFREWQQQHGGYSTNERNADRDGTDYA